MFLNASHIFDLEERITNQKNMPVRGPASVKLHRKEDAEILQLGAVTCFLLEDGTRTENRIAAVIMMVPPGTPGPPMHWARMHDECFFVTKGSFVRQKYT